MKHARSGGVGRRVRGMVVGLAVAGAVLAVGRGEAAAQVFLKLDGIDGESQDADHRGHIEIESWSWGTTTSGSTAETPPEGVRTLTFTRRADAASRRLATARARARRIARATLTLRRSGSREARTIRLANVRVSSVRTRRRAAGEVAMETVTLTFEGFEPAPPATRGARVRTPTTGTAATADAFLKLEGIDGESTDDGHARQIEVLSWSWGETSSSAAQPESPPAGATSLTITRRVSAPSTALSRARTRTERMPEAVLTVRRAGGSRTGYLVIRMEDVIISSYDTSTTRSSDGVRHTETLTLTFRRVRASTASAPRGIATRARTPARAVGR